MASGILVLCEHEAGAPKKTAFELLGKAASLAGGAPVTALLIGASGGGQLGGYGATAVLNVTGADFGTVNTGSTVAALQAAIAAVQPAVVLAPASLAAKDAFPRLAARIGAGLGTEVTELRAEGGKVIGRRPMYGGKALADVNITSSVALFTVRQNSFPQPVSSGAAAPVSALAVTVSGVDAATKVVGQEKSTNTVVDLTEADRIVSGGRSVKSAEGYDKMIRPLAAALGATPGASRAAVDAGYASHSHQVGQTGKTVNPTLYIAAGISGAIQHLAGMRTSRVIVAINTDADAPIFQVASYGLVGDLFTVCPLLTDELKAALAG